MAALQGLIPYKVVDNFKLPARIPAERFREAVHYSPLSGDIFLGSYPKTGSTWLQYVVYLIANQGQRPDDVAAMLATTPYVQRDGLHMNGCEAFMNGKRSIALKYQMPFNLMPFSSEAKYIYISRNPKDTCVSFYHFCKQVPGYNFQTGSLGDFFQLFLSGELPFGSYIENLISWYQNEGEENFLFMTFEQMKSDIRSTIVQLAEFLGYHLETGVVDKIERYSSLQYMKSHVDNQLQVYLNTNPDVFDLKQLQNIEVSQGDLGPQLVRKGDVHQWKSYFNTEQNEEMNRCFFEMTKGTNAQNLWPDIMTAKL